MDKNPPQKNWVTHQPKKSLSRFFSEADVKKTDHDIP